MNITSDYFNIVSTEETPTGKVFTVQWTYYFPKNFLRDLSKQAILCKWLQNGLYVIRQEKNRTVVLVDERIIREFAEVISYLAKRYGN